MKGNTKVSAILWRYYLAEHPAAAVVLPRTINKSYMTREMAREVTSTGTIRLGIVWPDILDWKTESWAENDGLSWPGCWVRTRIVAAIVYRDHSVVMARAGESVRESLLDWPRFGIDSVMLARADTIEPRTEEARKAYAETVRRLSITAYVPSLITHERRRRRLTGLKLIHGKF